ncbi:MAG TPA: Maf family protein [Dehalococcoidia bacterium]|nr:Maf family protein [Dehalococcoidia bacterium]
MRFVLASGSPRRSDLLTRLGFDFEVVPSTVDEESFVDGRPAALVRRIARAKAEDVASRETDAVVLAADTIVVLRGDVLNKPRDAGEAREMLTCLRGRWHRVITAVCVKAPGKRLRIGHVVTRVRIRPYEMHAIETSIARGEPFDKAGGYAIQDPDLAPVESYQGCYCNVMGLPLWTSSGMLHSAGVTPSRVGDMPPGCDACPLSASAV